MKFTVLAYAPSVLFWALFFVGGGTESANPNLGPLAFAGYMLWVFATPFVFVYWAARIVKRVWRGGSQDAAETELHIR